ncbi:hypothetical protein Phi19:2_gp006 [Cellulophaga phage phi19:2]|uniref:Uncharacterized protein n=3 Tax=Cellulophaga phage phiST TaxID=756282 RepID=M4SLD2_9CAUD|nr:hypothetical protein CGPG_00100 [Cellulophaga phage phiST]AGH56798.1 hypothetical protein CGPG_00100 [Cellulophaga phage phiST]AGO47145.1 hypothetical protein PhiST_gp006 [Cellulophaga phage phiST]AGO48641.1 hypothetical protein Phi19:2_gp006 [Cellulophaga phage phi19:2]AGO49017.1 hypothetical protein Phi13:1_gp006 [Cellulophaga phage phi13:1]
MNTFALVLIIMLITIISENIILNQFDNRKGKGDKVLLCIVWLSRTIFIIAWLYHVLR